MSTEGKLLFGWECRVWPGVVIRRCPLPKGGSLRCCHQTPREVYISWEAISLTLSYSSEAALFSCIGCVERPSGGWVGEGQCLIFGRKGQTTACAQKTLQNQTRKNPVIPLGVMGKFGEVSFVIPTLLFC